jgi:CRP-like cAMP-binding protein
VESIVEDFEAKNKFTRVIKRYGPGTYLYTKHGFGHREEVVSVRCLTDAKLTEIPSKPFEDFLRTSKKEGMVRFLLETQEEKGRVLIVTTTPFESMTTVNKKPPGRSFGWGLTASVLSAKE